MGTKTFSMPPSIMRLAVCSKPNLIFCDYFFKILKFVILKLLAVKFSERWVCFYPPCYCPPSHVGTSLFATFLFEPPCCWHPLIDEVFVLLMTRGVPTQGVSRTSGTPFRSDQLGQTGQPKIIQRWFLIFTFGSKKEEGPFTFSPLPLAVLVWEVLTYNPLEYINMR